jgi:plasmid stabilization system protein ParE
MKYRVIIEAAARQDLEAVVLWIAEHSREAAREWYWRVKEAIGTLRTSPFRCPLAPENAAFEQEIRHLLYGRRRYVYRILFTVRGAKVHVLHIRHGAREPLRPADEP